MDNGYEFQKLIIISIGRKIGEVVGRKIGEVVGRKIGESYFRRSRKIGEVVKSEMPT
jgi:hypothetical protein